MDSRNLTGVSEEGIDVESLLFVGAAAVACVGLLLYFRTSTTEAEFELPTDPPPIIIKSGSFEIESNQKLDESTNGSGGNPFVYSWDNFGEILGVRIYRINENNGNPVAVPFINPLGLEIDIILQFFDSDQERWFDISPPVTVKSEGSAGNPKNFKLRLNRDLDSKGKPKPPRKFKRRDKGSETIRIGKIVVRDKNGNLLPPSFQVHDGDDFFITIYNRLVET
jgi:hypothetical protein